MVAYALLPAPVGVFLDPPHHRLLVAGHRSIWVESRWHGDDPCVAADGGTIWYLVQEILGFFLRHCHLLGN